MNTTTETKTQEARFWQNAIEFKNGNRTTLTIQSEKGRSDLNEKIFVLESLGAIRAQQGWKFSFLGKPKEIPGFVPKREPELWGKCIPYWLDV